TDVIIHPSETTSVIVETETVGATVNVIDTTVVHTIPSSPIVLGTIPIGPRGPKGDDGLPGADGIDGLPGSDGTPGLSAYEVALENGFSGTEQEWLQSLIGTESF